MVFGSRFLSHGTHRVLYFWHYLGNAFLTFLSNMFTDLNLTDMETCYKVFRREVIQSITLKEDRFGIEPELVAKVAQMRLRIYEMGISYYGRTYEEGKKIGVKDGFRALYCIFHYNAHRAPLPIQFMIYVLIGGFCALVNVALFLFMFHSDVPVIGAAPVAYVSAAVLNYFLCIHLLFRHRARWTSVGEVLMYFLVVAILGLADLWMTQMLLAATWQPGLARSRGCFDGAGLQLPWKKVLGFSGNWSRSMEGVTGAQRSLPRAEWNISDLPAPKEAAGFFFARPDKKGADNVVRHPSQRWLFGRRIYTR